MMSMEGHLEGVDGEREVMERNLKFKELKKYI